MLNIQLMASCSFGFYFNICVQCREPNLNFTVRHCVKNNELILWNVVKLLDTRVINSCNFFLISLLVCSIIFIIFKDKIFQIPNHCTIVCHFKICRPKVMVCLRIPYGVASACCTDSRKVGVGTFAGSIHAPVLVVGTLIQSGNKAFCVGC